MFRDRKHSSGRTAKLLVPTRHHHHHHHHQASLLAPAAPSGFAPYSPHSGAGGGVGAPPPAHQSPRHVPFAAHPLPAHLHPVLNAATAGAGAGGAFQHLHAPPLHAPMYVNSPSGGAYLAHPVSPSKARQLQYQYLYEENGGLF